MCKTGRTVAATLAGRCANGHEKGAGAVVHAVECSDNELRVGINAYARSLCGKTHGARSAGWSKRDDLKVTCPKCLKLHKHEDDGGMFFGTCKLCGIEVG